jgi:FAD/FMN-containing dehydrogenase/Fe-S oxidoreductase
LQLTVLNNLKTLAPIEAAQRIDVRALEADLRRACEGEVRFDSTTRAIYSTDAGNYRQIPIGITIPRSRDEVVQIMKVCHAHGAPILPRGAATSLAGQCCNVAIVIDMAKYLTRVIEVDPRRRLARVEPGVRLDVVRDQIEERYGLTYAPDPATHAYCTFGGMIGNNSCGVHSMIGGRSADSVEELEVVTPDGLRLRVGPTSEHELERIIRDGGRRGQIYRGLREIRDHYGDLVRKRFPRIPRRVSGYNLDELLPERGFNVARALVGTEGTCATFLEATVQLHKWPRHRVLLVLGYPSVYEAGDHVKDILPFKPIGLEGMDDRLVEFIRKKGRHVENIQLLPDGKGWLMVEVGADSGRDAEDAARAIMRALGRSRSAPSMRLLTDQGEIKQIWEVRESGLGATAFVPGFDDAWPGWEDSAVHPHDLGDYLRDLRRLLDKHGYGCALYGHFGQACIHCRIDFDLTTDDGLRTYRHFLDEATDLVVQYKGSFTAEHGDGQARGIFLPKLFGPELVDAFRQFKTLWDPRWQMNPGKMLDADPPDMHLRLGTDYAPRPLTTHFQFPDDDGSFARAILRCVGVGKCLRTKDAFMCPTYPITLEEKHSTRGRARAFFEMMRGDFITSGWKSEEVKETLDLCISCKGCKMECPVNVDLATYKAEFLSHYYQGRMRPRCHYAMGLIDWWARLAQCAPGFANFAGGVPPLSNIAKAAAGIAQDRPLPRFAHQTFTQWFRRRVPRRRVPRNSVPSRTTRDFHSSERPDRRVRHQVLLIPDAFYNHFYPGALKAAVLVLERLGRDVIIPPRIPEIRPIIHYGMLELAKSKLRSAVATLAPFVRNGIPIICLEPSTVSVYRDELRNLFPHDIDASRLRDNIMLFSEYLARDHELLDRLPRLSRRAILHNHCHHKAVLDPQAPVNVLQRMGISPQQPEPGCCGMAGSFGFESDHYQVAMQLGERHLLPAVRAASRHSLIITEGFSCRRQIADATGRAPLHLSEVILMAMEHGPAGPASERPEQVFPDQSARLHPAPVAALALAGLALGGIALGVIARRC